MSLCSSHGVTFLVKDVLTHTWLLFRFLHLFFFSFFLARPYFTFFKPKSFPLIISPASNIQQTLLYKWFIIQILNSQYVSYFHIENLLLPVGIFAWISKLHQWLIMSLIKFVTFSLACIHSNKFYNISLSFF